MVTGMVACAVSSSFVALHRVGVDVHRAGPEILSSSLFIQGEIQFQRQRCNRKTIHRQVSSGGAVRIAGVGFI